ncbi:hypothetical protein [uncultured Sunxiuqinia sp.]|uniref:hypothetical protein n=1 Tax=uncultured Sunxiuqinia sp. TaxID=1573825 RepID=UPI002602592C|nr:hypothetical protein [uncultured Sunxiuqinia sp.]
MCDKRESKKAIIIDGVVLTDEAIDQLKSFQESDNYAITYFREYLADAICCITTNVGVKDELKELIEELSYLRGFLKNLRKP